LPVREPRGQQSGVDGFGCLAGVQPVLFDEADHGVVAEPFSFLRLLGCTQSEAGRGDDLIEVRVTRCHPCSPMLTVVEGTGQQVHAAGSRGPIQVRPLSADT